MARQRRNLIDAHRHAALFRWKGVGQNGRRIGYEEGATGALHHTGNNEFEGSSPAHTGQESQKYGGKGENEEAQVVHAHAAKDVAQTADGDHENRQDQHVAHEGPEK